VLKKKDKKIHSKKAKKVKKSKDQNLKNKIQIFEKVTILTLIKTLSK
jgi:hypothetical protein